MVSEPSSPDSDSHPDGQKRRRRRARRLPLLLPRRRTPAIDIGDYADKDEHPDGETTPGLVIYRFDAPLIFVNIDGLTEEIDTLLAEADPPATAVLVSAESITDLDITALDAITDYVEELRGRGIGFAVARLKSDLVEELERAEATDAFADAYFLETDDGVHAYLAGEFGAGS